MRTKKVYSEIASLLLAAENCRKYSNVKWLDKHITKIGEIVSNHAPSGSGIDCGTKFDENASNPEKLVFTFEYHHMNEAGYYDGWTSHKAIVTPSLSFGYRLRITGSDRNMVKDYFYDLFNDFLETELS